MMISRLIFPLSVLVGAMAAHFDWPLNTVACGTYPLKLTGGVPPFTVQIIPLDATPFGWNLNNPVNQDWFNDSWPIQVQLAAGTPYVVFVSDSGIFGNGGITPVQIVGTSNTTSCLLTAGQNRTAEQFAFNLYGTPTECDSAVRLTFDGAAALAPYNYTVVPLDGGYKPWNVVIPQGSNTVDVPVNMTAGSRFSVMLNNKWDYGAGKVGGVYQVGNSSTGTRGCQQQPYVVSSSYTWPSSLRAETLPPLASAISGSATASYTGTTAAPSQSLSPATDNNGKVTFSISTGAIAGIAVGAGLVIIGVGGLIWWLLRRRRRAGARDYSPGGHLDIIGGGGAGGHEEGKTITPAPKVEPFRSHSDYVRSTVPVQGYEPVVSPSLSQSSNGISGGNGGGQAYFPNPQPTGQPGMNYAQSSDGKDSISAYYNQGGSSGGGYGVLSPASGSGSGSQGISSSTDLLNPSTGTSMLLGQSSTAHEKARLAQQYAQMDMTSSGPPAGPSSPASSTSTSQPMSSLGSIGATTFSPGTPFGPNHPSYQSFQSQPGDQGQRQPMGSPGSIGSTSPIPASPPAEQSGGVGRSPGQLATFRRHTDAGQMEEEQENRAPEGVVDLPPMYEDVPQRRQ